MNKDTSLIIWQFLKDNGPATIRELINNTGLKETQVSVSAHRMARIGNLNRKKIPNPDRLNHLTSKFSATNLRPKPLGIDPNTTTEPSGREITRQKSINRAIAKLEALGYQVTKPQ